MERPEGIGAYHGIWAKRGIAPRPMMRSPPTQLIGLLEKE